MRHEFDANATSCVLRILSFSAIKQVPHGKEGIISNYMLVITVHTCLTFPA